MELENKVLTINIKDLICIVTKSFEKVLSSTIIKSWRKILLIIEKDVVTKTGRQPNSTRTSARCQCDLVNELERLSNNELQKWVMGGDEKLG